MNKSTVNKPAKLNMMLVGKIGLGGFILAVAGVVYVWIMVQQHVLGEQTRRAEFQLRDLRSFNQVLRSEISTMTSHACISKAVSGGSVALVAISDQHLARFGSPSIIVADSGLLTASASASVSASASASGGRRP